MRKGCSRLHGCQQSQQLVINQCTFVLTVSPYGDIQTSLAYERASCKVGQWQRDVGIFSLICTCQMMPSGQQSRSDRTGMDRKTFITAIAGTSSRDMAGRLQRLDMWYEDGRICGLRIQSQERRAVMLGRRSLCACLGFQPHRQLDHATKMAKCEDLNTVLASYLASTAHSDEGGDVEALTVYHAKGRVIGIEIWLKGRAAIVLGRRSLQRPMNGKVLVLDAQHFDMSADRLTLVHKS